MTSSTEEALSRYIKSLSAEYDVQSKTTRTQPLMRGRSRISVSMTPAMFPQMHEPECICSLPCLSLGTRGRQWNSNTNESLNEIDVEYLKHLLSRPAQFSKHHIASSSILRNIVSTFGCILELELHGRLYSLMDRLDRVKDVDGKRQRKEAIYQSFLKQSLSTESPALPVSAQTNFCTVMPVKDWSQVDKSREQVTLGMEFECEICLHFMPNGSLTKCIIGAPGEITGLSQSQSGILESVNVSIDMTMLLKSIKRECKSISKQIINSIVGFDLSDKRTRRRVGGGGTVGGDSRSTVASGAALTAYDAATHPTVASIDDNSASTRCHDHPPLDRSAIASDKLRRKTAQTLKTGGVTSSKDSQCTNADNPKLKREKKKTKRWRKLLMSSKNQ